MALRLQTRLGEWVTLTTRALAAELTSCGGARPAELVERPARLFARVLDLPGGMRIGTIHAFCQSLLRRFPLEAALAPHFRLLEDADGHAELDGAREDALAAADPAALARPGRAGHRRPVRQAGRRPAPPCRRPGPLLAPARPGPAARCAARLGVAGRRCRPCSAAVAWRGRRVAPARCAMQAHGTPASASRPSACSAG